MSLKVNIRHLEADEVQFDGELSAEELDLAEGDELVHARQSVRYALTAQKAGREMLVQGQFRLKLDCECARCLKPFQEWLEVKDWTVLVALEGDEKAEIKDDCVDLTPYLREDILLAFPQHPLCGADCAGLPNRAVKSAKQARGVSQTPGSSVWSELNKLKF